MNSQISQHTHKGRCDRAHNFTII